MSQNKILMRIQKLKNEVEVLEEGFDYQILTNSGYQNFVLTEMQERIFLSNLKVNYILKSRQLGITSVLVLKAVHTIYRSPGKLAVIVCPSEAQVLNIISMISVLLKDANTEMTYQSKILSIKHSGKIFFVNSRYDACRGLAADYIYITEGQSYSDLNKVFQAVLPTIITRPSAQLYCDGTVPETIDNDFINLFPNAEELIEKAYKELIVTDEKNQWVLFNHTATRDEIGDSFDREILMELPTVGEKIKIQKGTQYGSLSKTIVFEYRQGYYKTNLFSCGYLSEPIQISLKDIKAIYSNEFNIYIDKVITNKLCLTKQQKERLIIFDKESLYFETSEHIQAKYELTFFVHDTFGVAMSSYAQAALIVCCNA